MGKYLKVVICSFLFVVLQHMAKIIYLFGFHKTVYDHAPGPCRILEGVDFGSEDIATLPDGKAFITSGLLLPQNSPTFKAYLKANNAKGKIFFFDFNQPEKNPTDLEIRGKDMSNFRPHGIDYWQNTKTDQIFLFVVNHEEGHLDSIEKLEFKNTYLQHIHTYQDKTMVVLNDVAVTGENSFYFSNYLRFRSGSLNTLEMLLMLPLGTVAYYDGNKYSVEIESMFMPNGLALSLDKRQLFIATSLSKVVKVFHRHPTQGSLSFLQELNLHTQPDNPTVDPLTGDVLVGAQPVLYCMPAHFEDVRLPCASQVLMIKVEDGHMTNVTELYSNNGQTISGTSVASLYGNKMLIGTIHHKLLYCDVKVL